VPFRNHCRRPLVNLATVACTVVAILHAAAGALALEETVGGIGDKERLVVRGLRQIDPERLRLALIDDSDLVWLSRPGDSREDFIAAVVGKATLALERAGFLSPHVQANVESSAGIEQLVLDVTEGERLTAGRIEVSGLPDETAARLVRFLSERQPPLDAVPRSVDQPDGTSAISWVDDGGQPVTLLDPEWVPDRPAACDTLALRSVRAAVARFLRHEGYLAIAPIVEGKASSKLGPNATCTVHSTWIDVSGTHEAFEVSLRRADGVADLVVVIKDLPPISTLRGLELPATCRTSSQDLGAFLGIAVGGPVTERDRIEWRDKLRRSGRFLRHEVELRADPRDPAAVVATFDLEEYPHASPLGKPLTRAEATMLRFHEWLVDAVGQGDLMIDIRRRTQDPASAGITARLVVSPKDGLVLTALQDGELACGMIASGMQISLVPPGATGRLDVPLPPRMRLTVTISLSLSRDPATDERQPTYSHNLSCGCGTASGDDAADGGMKIEMRVEPVACLAMVHENDPSISFEGDTLVIATTSATCRIDAATGRPLGLVVNGCEVVAEKKPAAVVAAVAALHHAAGPSRLREAAPVTSAVEFLCSDGVVEAWSRLTSVAGFSSRKTQLDRLAPESNTIRCFLNRCLADGGIARCDKAVVAAVRSPREPTTEPLEIPRDDAARSPQAVEKTVVREIAALVWQCVEAHCGRESWPASVMRAAACGLVNDPTIRREMIDFMSQDDYGPLAHACAATLAPVPAVATSLALRGQERLSTTAFHADCQPLLEALRRYGLDECAVSVLRSIDDDDAREIGRATCSDAEFLLPLVRELRARDTHDAAVDELHAALDAWWEQTLRSLVAARLASAATPRTATAPAEGGDTQLRK
jgi:hypothetical protein